ncbi:hypothetical protein [Pseudomonas cichorii]|nr:hypothetical protein [Pseudomonas cichorii]AHF65490.1 hypothetical protein PCH70_03370 [Pseudomonas cichorii JBC1]QVE17500.1 hypothetical protein KGD89_01625 [Pseudomonas cichorii]SDN96771.1 hypothetical protein SAMN05216599_104331 [Pseudomonas cichorii]GFM76575.1 hypothetical protein PSCICM_23940 [Pseudomonas cichorii]GFM92191.1 hypothetical protein PSCICP_21630 [Pseudomonas cichorii]
MATQYIQNGNFKDDFNYWKGPVGFDPGLERYGLGQSILLPVATNISQSLPDLPGTTLLIEFDALSADAAVEEATFVVSVGGFRADGVIMVSPVTGLATPDWQRFSVNMYFEDDLTSCFLNVSTPRPAVSASSPDIILAMSPVRFGDFSLVESDIG